MTDKTHSIYDCIHQQFIDMNSKSSINDIQKLLIKAQQYLINPNIDIYMATEIFSLILKCYSYIPNDYIQIFTLLLKNARKNSFSIIITSSIFSYLSQTNPNITNQEYEKFAKDCINEIIPQIKNKNSNLFIFKYEIPFQFQFNLILDLILTTELDEKSAKCLISYIFSHGNPKFFNSNKNKLISLVRKLIKTKSIEYFATILPIIEDFYSKLDIHELSIIIPFLTEKLFYQFFPQIEQVYLNSIEIDSTFLTFFFQKCNESNVKLQSIEKAFQFLTPEKITPQIINYVKKYDLTLPEEIAKNYYEYQDLQFVFKINQNLQSFPHNVLEKGLLEMNDLNFFRKILSINDFTSPVFQTSKFYVHVISLLGEQSVDDPDHLVLKSLSKTFQKHINNYVDTINEIIFSFYSSNNNNIPNIIISFINYMESHYKNEIIQVCLKMIIKKILEMKALPSCSFLQFITYNSLLVAYNNANLMKKDINTRFYYIFFFSEHSNYILDQFSQFNLKIEIQTQLFIDFDKLLIDFISTNNYNILHLLDEKSFTFAIHALFSGIYKNVSIFGLTKETVIPFYAILLKNCKYKIGSYFFEDKEATELFFEGLEFTINQNSPVYIASKKSLIESIQKSVFTQFSDIKIKVIDIFVDSLSKSQCVGCKDILISYLTSNINYLKYIKSDLKELFKSILNDKTINSIIFMEKMINRLEYFKDSNKNFEIPFEYLDQTKLVTLIPILNHIKANQTIEEDDFMINFLFKKMINNDSMRKGYLFLRLQSQNNNHIIMPNEMFNLHFKNYFLYQDDFKEVFKHLYEYNRNENVYIRRESLNCQHFLDGNFNFGISIINDLFSFIKNSEGNYEAFYCLKSIACTFLFLFENNPNQIFESVLPELEYYLILFDDINNDENQEIERLAKTAISSFSFLISSLHSCIIMDSFIEWYFQNLEKFSYIQIFCFNYIFNTILLQNEFKHIIVSSFIKYNYVHTISLLLNNNIPNGTFRDNYNKLMLSVLFKYLYSFQSFNQVEVIMIDELQRIKYPFYHDFNHYSILMPLSDFSIRRCELDNLPSSQLNSKLFNFVEKIEKPRQFWLNYLNNSNSYHYDYDYILTSRFFKDTQIYHSNSIINLIIQDRLTVCYIRNIYKISPWVCRSIVYPKNTLVFNEDEQYLQKLINEYGEMGDYLLDDINVNEYFNERFDKESIFNILTNHIISSSLNDPTLICMILNLMLNDNKTVIPVLNSMAKNFDIINEITDDEECNYFNNLLSVLLGLSNLKQFKDNFIEIFETKLHNMIMKPQYRTNDIILSKVINIIEHINLDLKQFYHSNIFKYMYSSQNEEIIYKTIILCEKYFPELNNENMNVINMIKKEISKSILNIDRIIQFVKIPSLVPKIESQDIYILLEKLFQMLINGDENMKDIVKIINILTPDRSNLDPIIFQDMENSINQDPSLPLALLNSNSFWNYFYENKQKIYNIIEEKQLHIFNKNCIDNADNTRISLKLFDEYPVLFPFSFRFKLFMNTMKNEIDPSILLYLFIHRNTIVENSLSQLKTENIYNWKSKFKIQYYSENGNDYGGLRRDWFISISKRLFDPDFGLFSITENKNYLPSIQSSCEQNYLKLFKFTGLLIARTIIQGENIYPHLNHLLLCNILKRKINIQDMKQLDESIYNSLFWLLENDLNLYESYEQYFEIEQKFFDTVKTLELIENGSNIKVANENKSQYVQCIIDYFSRYSIESQLQSFLEGFYSLIPLKFIQIFSSCELDLIISGKSKIDVNDMIQNISFVDPYTKDTPVVVLFFDVISKWDQDDLEKLLFFITGSSKVPAMGFKYYKDINIPIRIQNGGDKSKLPAAHTCFNILDLPQYETSDELESKFKIAINETSFGLV